MKIGVIVPQGWTNEYDGWDTATAWMRSRDIGWQAEALGFESIWLFDHFHTAPVARDAITFEAFTSLAALAAETRRVRLGHIVLCAAYRNPALTAKMISTLDVISGGRAELGLGAGWKRDEWVAFGYGFPDAPQRLAMLKDTLEVVSAMMAPGRATYRGDHALVDGAINVPKPIQQPRVPIIVGGNGPNVTWRLAARYADELNLDGLSPDELNLDILSPADVAKAMPVIRQRCEEIDRDPATLRVSVHAWWEHLSARGEQRVELLGRYAELGVSRVIGMIREAVDSDEALADFADDARAAGAEMADSTAIGA
jgi:alkanesulfonate monooxygenase SsuD/methylene tetrahydromethanopterin reductase-like flavin-dependent oxidoreductase (luciferase family)